MNKNGFTLVEMVAVVVLLGVLMAISIPLYNNFVQKANETKDAARLSSVEDATKSLMKDCAVNQVPTSLKSYCASFKTGPVKAATGLPTTVLKGTDLSTYLQALKNNQYVESDVEISDIVYMEVAYDSSKYNYDVKASLVDPDEE